MNRREIAQIVGIALMITGFLVFEGAMIILSIATDTVIGIVMSSLGMIAAGAMLY